jgi:Cu-processing system ATP-binding protein
MEGLSSMTSSIEIRSLGKSFGQLNALEGVSLSVAPGEILALLGHNGAGKTTLFRILLGFISADTGLSRIAGFPAGSRDARRVISYLPENVAFPKTLTGLEVVELYAKLKGADKREAMPALERFGLAEASKRRCGTYSKGMRQRLGLAQAIVGHPEILLMDEPTSGLDPLSRTSFYRLVSEMAERGTSVLLSSHGLSELEARAGRIAILRRGRLVADGPLRDLQNQANLPIRIRVRATPTDADALQRQIGGNRVNGASIELTCVSGEKMRILKAIHGSSAEINDVEVMPPSLDEVYRYFSANEQDAEARS